MITVTDSAKQELTRYFDGKEIQPIRIHLADGGCSGPRLSLALDEVRDGDKTVEQDAFTFLIQEELAGATGAVTVDMTQYGFNVESENQVGGGAGCGCTSASSCGSAGSGGCGCGH
jgi:Fe-S cluster assembly iron-binding protein IscA